MNTTPWIIGLVIVVALFGGYVLVSKNTVSTPHDTAMENAGVPEGESMKNEGGTMQLEGGSSSVMTSNAGTYEPYAPQKLALASSGKVVLFFRASWCPTCRALDADIKAHLGAIPEGVTILDVDYDNSTALKQKYGVTMQHTLVQVDADGNLITKWTGSPTLMALAGNLK